MNAVKAEHISFSYDKKSVLENVSLTIQTGEFLGIIGPNGAGKSTALRLMCNILRPQKGSIMVFNENIRSLEPRQLAKKIAFVPQETYFSLDFTVEDIVMMGRFPYLRAFQKETRADLDARDHALEYADVENFRKRMINSLSSGERQRVVLARALAQEPDILMLDEPTSHLDLHHQYAIMELLKKLNKEGMTIIIVNHDLNLASLYCTQLVLLHDHRIYKQGEPKDLITEAILNKVYHTRIKIIKHPDTGIPHILLMPGGGRNEDNKL
jgi:iron complex transport system ATP-binding protein